MALRKSPQVIAGELVASLAKGIGDLLTEVIQAGPYVNVFIHPKIIGSEVIQKILTGSFFEQKQQAASGKIMIEYSQPNTHKELHVGHMRNLCLGDALIKLFRHRGYEVISATFPGDIGTHVAKCLWYLKYHNQEPIPVKDKGAWLGKMYSRAHLKLEEETGTEHELENKKALSQILTQIEQQQGEFYDLWLETRQWSLELMEKVYEWAGVHFDQWYWESEVDASSVELVKEYFEKGLFQESEGVIGIDLSEYDLGFCVLLKSDGHGLYATKDLELAKRKFEGYDLEQNLYVVDLRQGHHFAQVFKILELMGYEKAARCAQLAYNYVELPDGPMSSRKGNIIPLMELIFRMEAHASKELETRYAESWSTEDIQNTAQIIARGAIKYGMLRIDPGQKIVFDMNSWLDLKGDSGPYLQYTVTRLHSLCQKQGSRRE